MLLIHTPPMLRPLPVAAECFIIVLDDVAAIPMKHVKEETERGDQEKIVEHCSVSVRNVHSIGSVASFF